MFHKDQGQFRMVSSFLINLNFKIYFRIGQFEASNELKSTRKAASCTGEEKFPLCNRGAGDYI